MPVRIIERPENIVIRPPDPEAATQELSFAEFVARLLLQPKWGSDYRHVRMAAAIERAVAEEGDQIGLAEEDWRALKEAVEKPTGPAGFGYQVWALRQLLPFMDAIVEAQAR